MENKDDIGKVILPIETITDNKNAQDSCARRCQREWATLLYDENKSYWSVEIILSYFTFLNKKTNIDKNLKIKLKKLGKKTKISFYEFSDLIRKAEKDEAIGEIRVRMIVDFIRGSFANFGIR